MKFSNRRSFFTKSFAGLVSALFARSAFAKIPTPSEVEGPFYPIIAQKDKDFDLTSIQGNSELAKGKIIHIHGKVLDINLNPIENVTVDLWQANAAGRYRHPHDSNSAPLDKNFQGWAIVQSGKQGGFKFKTIYPGQYPVNGSWTRPPHIHFKISKAGYSELITQMYFPDNKLNDVDLLLQRKTSKERSVMIATKIKDDPETYEYNVVLTSI